MVSEKYLLEENAAKYFMMQMNKDNGTNFVVLKHWERPDFILQDLNTKRVLGVEVTHLFYSAQEAKALLGHSLEDYDEIENLDDYIKVLNRLIARKREKVEKYPFSGEMFLLIRAASPSFKREDFENNLDEIMVPDNKFKRICILFYDYEKNIWQDLMFIK